MRNLGATSFWGSAPVFIKAFSTRRFWYIFTPPLTAVTKYEYYAQRTLIAELFSYRVWSVDFLPLLTQQAAQIVRRDVTPGFIVAELIAYLNEHKIVRPGYTTLQTLISEALSAERRRPGRPARRGAGRNGEGCAGRTPGAR